MLPFAELVLAFAWTFGANGHLIDRQLTGGEALPVAWLERLSERASIVFHDREDWAMAFYVAAEPAAKPVDSTPTGPRLALFAPYYLAPDGLVTPAQMPVDVAEYYFHALIEAALDQEPDLAYVDWSNARAAELMTSAPEAQRSAAYASALANFGAHLLAIRNEVSRLARHQATAGRDLCRHLDQPASLFGLWRRSLEEGRYAGDYLAPEGDSPPRWRTSHQVLERSDKDRFLTEVLGVTWSGDPRVDFETLCPD